MSKQPIEQAPDADLRLSAVALLRASQRARELAQRTGTASVTSRQGVIEKIRPHTVAANPAQAPATDGEGEGAA